MAIYAHKDARRWSAIPGTDGVEISLVVQETPLNVREMWRRGFHDTVLARLRTDNRNTGVFRAASALSRKFL